MILHTFNQLIFAHFNFIYTLTFYFLTKIKIIFIPSYYHKQIVSNLKKINTIYLYNELQLQIIIILFIKQKKTKQKQKKMIGSKKFHLTIATINNKDVQIDVSDDLTGFQLKQYIYTNVTQSLDAVTMKLTCAGVKIQNDKKLLSYKNIFNNNSKVAKVLQTKCDIDQIPGLIVAYVEDPRTCQQKTTQMPCGHIIGRDCMTQFIKSLIDNNKYKIICPSYKPNGSQCSTEWDYALCKKVGVFTKQQILKFEQGLSNNWIKQFAIQCPSCREALFRGDLKTDRVRCFKCKYGDFCALCLKKWIGTDNNICGNKDCKITDQFLQKSPWNKVFLLNNEQTGKVISINVPQHRACPKCHIIIDLSSGCKHMTCKLCKQQFCFVCLSLKQNGKWSCKGAFQYCGKIAQVQKIT